MLKTNIGIEKQLYHNFFSFELEYNIEVDPNITTDYATTVLFKNQHPERNIRIMHLYQ